MAGFLEHVALVMDVEGGEAQDAVNLMTLHAAKGLEFDTVFPARLGGGAVPAPALAGRAGPRGPRRGAAARVCRPHARQAPRAHLFRLQPAHPRAVELDAAEPLPRRAAGGGCGGRGGERRLRRGAALWPRRGFRLALRNAGLEAGAGRGRRARQGLRGAARRPLRARAGDDRGQDRGALGRRAGRVSRAASACFTRNSATARSRPWTATSSACSSTRPARRGWWRVSWSGCERVLDGTAFIFSSCPGLTRASMQRHSPRDHPMDCRVKPGNEGEEMARQDHGGCASFVRPRQLCRAPE